MFSATAPSEHNIWILRRFPSDHQLASQFKQWAKNDWLVQKKKSLFRSLCSTFNDLEKFNELKTLNPYIYNTFSFNFFKNLFTHCAILLLKNNMELIEEETAWNNCSIILIPFNRRVTSNSNDSTKMLIWCLALRGLSSNSYFHFSFFLHPI